MILSMQGRKGGTLDDEVIATSDLIAVSDAERSLAWPTIVALSMPDNARTNLREEAFNGLG